MPSTTFGEVNRLKHALHHFCIKGLCSRAQLNKNSEYLKDILKNFLNSGILVLFDFMKVNFSEVSDLLLSHLISTK